MSVQNGISICKIMDYRKFLYEQKKKEKQGKQITKDIKEIKIKPNIDIHDLKIKANKATELLNEGHKVKLMLIYRGREKSRIGEGKELIQQFISNLSTDIILKEPKLEGSNYILILEK